MNSQGYFCALFTHGVQRLAFVHKALSPPVFAMQIQMYGEGSLGNLVTCSDVRRIRRKTHGSHCLSEFTIHQSRAQQ